MTLAAAGPLAIVLPGVGLEVPVEIVVTGVISGLAYGLLAVGLVVVYKSTRVINFAHAAVGALTSGIMLVLCSRGVPYGVGLAAAFASAVAIGLVSELVVVRRLVDAPRLVLMVATIGLSQVLLALNLFIPRRDLGTSSFPVPFDVSVRIGNLRLLTGEVLILVVMPLVVVGLTVFFRRSRIGLAARAAAENLEAARLCGAPARRVSMVIWVLAALLATVSAVLIAATRPVSSFETLGPSLMLRALAAAVIGGFASLPQVFVGGIAVGVVEAVVSFNYPTGGATELVLFAAVLAAMLVRRDLSRAVRGSEATSWSLGGAARRLEGAVAANARVRRARTVGYAGVLGLAILGPISSDSGRQVLLSSIVLFALMGISVTVLTGFCGQVSLGQFAFVGLGAVVGGRMFQLGFPAWVGIVYAMVAGGVVAFLIGLPALRVRGLFLAVVTLGFAVTGGTWLLEQRWLVVTTSGQTSRQLPRQRWFGVDFQRELAYYYLVLGVLVLVALIVSRIPRTGLGRSFMAVRDNEAAAAALSIPVRRVKLTGFVLSGMIAGLAGYLYGGLLVNFTQANLFDPAASLQLVALVIFGGVTTVTGAVVGALWIRGIPYFLGPTWGILSSGLGVIVILQFVPGGLSELLFRLRDRLAHRLASSPTAEASDPSTDQRAPLPRRDVPDTDRGGIVLAARNVSVHFGGLVAVDGVDLEARRGEIVGLVGPNGAGKSTLFDVLAGQVGPTSGEVVLEGEVVTALRPEQRSRLGLGRSFQDARLFPDLTLLDAFQLALEREAPSEVVPSVLALPPSLYAERDKAVRAAELLELLGLTAVAHRHCRELSTGTRRFAELGCLLAMGSRVVLLDEPTAGVAQREVEAFVPVLKEMRAHLDATMIVIDHDLPMMVGLVDRLYVMSAGRLIAEGDPHDVREDPAVIAAYLGTDERAIRRSGALLGGTS